MNTSSDAKADRAHLMIERTLWKAAMVEERRGKRSHDGYRSNEKIGIEERCV